jgi:predicted nucleotidyltransferase
MLIIGSTLIGTAMPNSDLDILFLVPKFGQNLYEQYLPSFFKHLREAIKNEAELNKFIGFFWSI